MSSEAVAAIARTLLQSWDVLHVRDMDAEPEREYLAEAADLAALLGRGAHEAELARYLANRAAELGVRPDRTRDRAAAAALLSPQ